MIQLETHSDNETRVLQMYVVGHFEKLSTYPRDSTLCSKNRISDSKAKWQIFLRCANLKSTLILDPAIEIIYFIIIIIIIIIITIINTVMNINTIIISVIVIVIVITFHTVVTLDKEQMQLILAVAVKR